MSTEVHITGTSSGLGKALAEYYCRQEQTHVHGYARRTASIDSSHYTHHEVDITDSSFTPDFSTAVERIILINNAGWIGPVAPVGQWKGEDIDRLFQLNVSAVFRWTNAFVQQASASKKVVITISSGAASNVIPSWSAYCASKAAIDMATRVWNEDHPEISFLAIAPGVVQTEMQAEVRASNPADFPAHQRFVDLFEQGELKPPQEVAEMIGPFGFWPERAPKNVFSVREL